MKLTLEAWAAKQYAQPPHIKTLRRWVREDKIHPIPRKHGRAYYVEEHARHIDDFSQAELRGKGRVAAQA